MNIQRFDGWIIICPHCGHKQYVNNEDIAFNPMDDCTHFIDCEICNREFEVYFED